VRPTTIIASAALVNQEIAAEFGPLPPSFLPIGHQRLFDLQITRAAALPGRIVLTLPQSFEAAGWDLSRLRSRGVELLPIPDGLSLGDSILYALTLVGARGSTRLLHGDTAFHDEFPVETDIVSVARASTSYAWGYVEASGRFQESGMAGAQGRPVLTGFFAFSKGEDLARALTLTRGDFLEALNRYSESSAPLSLHEIGGWLDCGHLQTFYRARTQMTTARAFNDLRIDRRVVEKSSASNEGKVRLEASWFEALPPILRLHTPSYLGSESDGERGFSYRLAYEFSPTLHELFVFGRLGQPTWRQILESAFDFLNQCQKFRARETSTPVLESLVLHKTRDRLEALARTQTMDLTADRSYAGRALPSLARIAEIAASAINVRTESGLGIMHGDFCFPNLFYDFRQQIVKVIDPRGSIDGSEASIHGDVRYDLAKLNHSIEGYDLILSNRYVLDRHGEHDVTIAFPQEGPTRWLSLVAGDFSVAGKRVSDPEILALTIHLFLSMLPLHADRPDRQRAFLANALRLFVVLDS
jgi:hypothetical protein